jgi:hypothetical protein
MTDNQMKKAQAQSLIAQALKFFRGASYVKQSKKVISSGNYGDLSREQIDQGVVAFVVHCNLSGGSVGAMNLYKLIGTYLLNPLAQSDLNAVVGRYGV